MKSDPWLEFNQYLHRFNNEHWSGVSPEAIESLLKEMQSYHNQSAPLNQFLASIQGILELSKGADSMDLSSLLTKLESLSKDMYQISSKES